MPGARSPGATSSSVVAPNMYGRSAWNLLHVTLLAPTVLKWLIDFWKTGVPHFKVQFIDFSVRLVHVKKKRVRHCNRQL